MRQEANVFGWDYTYENESFKVNPIEKIESPEELYKLYGLSKYSVDALMRSYIYVPHPDQLNDIFDCNVELIQFDDEDFLNEFLKGAIPYQKLEKLLKDDLENLSVFAQRHFREVVYRKWAVCSMTSEPNNVLMWSYYGENRGFCIEFDISKLEFEFFGPFPINYQKEINALSIRELGVAISTLIQCNVKDAIWDHENEWRLMVMPPKGEDFKPPKLHKELADMDGHDRKMSYPISAIKSIALGNRFFLPMELKEINGKELEANLEEGDNTELKRNVLDFLSKNEILCHLGMRSGFTRINFLKCKIKRLGTNRFSIKAI